MSLPFNPITVVFMSHHEHTDCSFFSAGKHQSIQDVLNRGKNVLFTHNADVTASCACHMLHACRMLIMHICSIYSACVCFVHQLWENNYVNCIIF